MCSYTLTWYCLVSVFGECCFISVLSYRPHVCFCPWWQNNPFSPVSRYSFILISATCLRIHFVHNLSPNLGSWTQLCLSWLSLVIGPKKAIVVILILFNITLCWLALHFDYVPYARASLCSHPIASCNCSSWAATLETLLWIPQLHDHSRYMIVADYPLWYMSLPLLLFLRSCHSLHWRHVLYRIWPCHLSLSSPFLFVKIYGLLVTYPCIMLLWVIIVFLLCIRLAFLCLLSQFLNLHMKLNPTQSGGEQCLKICVLLNAIVPKNWFLYLLRSIWLVVVGLITDGDEKSILELKQHLSHQFQTKTFGWLLYFLSIEVAQSKDDIVIYRQKYMIWIF